MKRPLVLCILDGFAFRDETEGNAIKAANKPNLDKLFAEYKLLHDYFGRGENNVMKRLKKLAAE